MNINFPQYWTECKFQQLLDYIQPGPYIVENTNYDDSYETPVLTAGKSFIKGYSNENFGVFEDLPVIIFDDFTTATQFVNFPFKVKSSAMKILLRTSSEINLRFIYYLMQVTQLNTDSHKRYWIGIYSKLPIHIPCPYEQNRIVSKIEELFSELDKGIESLKTAREQLKVYRQALLKHAFEGKLTEQWRKDNTEQLETAEQLLERIKQEREDRYQQHTNDWKEAVKEWESSNKEEKKPAKPVTPECFNNIGIDEESKLYNLPYGWCRTKFINLIEYVTSGSRGWAKYYSESGAIFIRAQNLKFDRLELNDIAYVELPNNVEGKRTLIKKGDLLVTITGANVTKTAYVKESYKEAYVSQHVALCRPVNTQYTHYLFMFLIAGVAGRKQLEKLAYGAGKPGLNLSNIKDLIVPIASIDECNKLAELLDEKNSIVDQLENDIDNNLLRIKSLRQSILKKAFSGKLVPQDPNDEPASELLKRIAQEKAELEAQEKAAKAAIKKSKPKTKKKKILSTGNSK